MSGYATAMMRYAQFSGRSSRPEFWSFTLLSNLVIGGSAQALDILAGTQHRCFFLVFFVHLIPSLAVASRRMHDTNRSGWWYLLIFTGVGLIPLIVFYCQRGTVGPNDYGPPDGDDDILAGMQRLPGARPVGPHIGADTVAELERLAALRLSGALTEAEFAIMKERVLSPTQGVRIEPSF